MRTEAKPLSQSLVEFKNQLFEGQLFDQRIGLPERICGIKTKQVLSLASAAEQLVLAFDQRRADKIKESREDFKESREDRKLLLNLETRLEGAIGLYSLMHRVAQGEKLSIADVRPYRAAIKKAHVGLYYADSLIGCVCLFPPAWLLAVPGRIALNRRVERGFIEVLPDILQQVPGYIEKAWPYVEYITGFENPRLKFQEEVEYLVKTIVNHTETSKRMSRSTNESQLAGLAIQQTVKETLNEETEISVQIPLIRGLAFPLLPEDFKIPEGGNFGIVAPEVMKALVGVLPKERQEEYEEFIWRLEDNPHPLKGFEHLWPPAGRKVEAIKTYLPKLLRSLRDVLPSDGQYFQEKFLQQAEIFGANLR